MTEGDFQAKAIKYLESRGAYVVNQWGTPVSGSGVPDLLVCYHGRFVALECKHPEAAIPNGLTVVHDRFAEPAQRMHLARIRKAGGEAFVINGMPQLELMLDWIDHDEI